jgi:hypothetical protein
VFHTGGSLGGEALVQPLRRDGNAAIGGDGHQLLHARVRLGQPSTTVCTNYAPDMRRWRR